MAQIDYLRTRARALASLFGEVLPARFGRNRVEGKLGEGAMGIVYLATDPSLDRRCAIKVLHAADEDADRAVLREARALASLSHPNIVQIYEVTRYEQRTCIVMEYVEGPTLRAWLAERPRSIDEIVDVFAQAGAGLAAAHAHGLVHRDFKPDNVLMGSVGAVRPRVVDFGLARVHAESQTPPERDGVAAMGLATLTAARVGTPAYMAPEQHEGAETDARCDQYAFCVSLYEALQGQRPFAGKTAVALFEAKCNERPPWPKAAPTWLRTTVERGLAPRPGDRFPDIDRLRRGARSRVGLVLAASACIVAIGGALALPAPQATCEAGRESIAAVWNPERARQLEQSFAATALPYASEAAERVTSTLDARASSWAELYDEACAGGPDPVSELDARISCLRRQRAALEELSDTLVNADAKVVEHAMHAIDRAPVAEACRMVGPGAAGLDHERREELDALHRRLAAATTARLVGRYDEAWPLATAVLVDARAFGDDALLAEALYQVASIADDRSEYAESESLLRESAAVAMRAHRDDLVATADVELVLVAGERQTRGESLDDLYHRAEASLQRAGDPPFQRLRLHEFVGAALFAQGRGQEAMPHYEQALALASELEGAESLSIGSIASNIGHALMNSGDPKAALEYLDRADRIFVTHAPQHPNHAGVVTNRALALLALSRFEESVVEQRRALDMKIAMFGPTHPRLCTTLNGLAQTYDRLAQRDVALVYAGWGFAIVEAHPEIADTRDGAAMRIGWAAVMQNLGSADAAERALMRAAESMRQLRHPQLAVALGNLALLAVNRGQPARAVQLGDEALAVVEATSSPHAPGLVQLLRVRGAAHTANRDYAAAEADLQRALDITEHNQDANATQRVLRAFAELEIARGRPDAAAEHRARIVALGGTPP